MKRLLIFATLLTTALVIAIVLKLRSQQAVLQAPAGGSGVIEGTALELGVQISARVEQVAVEKGQSVKAGQLLVTLDCAEVEASIAEAQARVDAARAQQSSAEASVVAAKRAVGVAYAQAAAARTRGEVVEQRQASARRNADRLVQVGDGVTVAALDKSQTEVSALSLEREAARATAQATAAQAGVSAAQGNVAEASVSAAAASLASIEAAARRVALLRRECKLEAPRAGVIEEVYVEAGEVARPGAVLVRLVDLDEVTLTFYLPNAELGTVQPQSPVTVLADAYPSANFAGRVRTIASEAAFTPRNIQTRTDRDRLVYPIEVVIPNSDHRLRPGMPAEARVEQ